MRFMVIVKSDAKTDEAGAMPSEAELSEMGAYNDQLIKAGVMLAGEGLHPSRQGVRVRLAKGKYSVTDGPFAEAKELVAGFWVIEAKSTTEALDWAKRVPFAAGEVELRPLFGPEDFPADDNAAATAGPAANPQAVPAAKGPRYMVILHSDALTESDTKPTQAGLAAMDALIGEMVAKGAGLGGEGLKPTKYGKRVMFAGNGRTVIDGPFAETKELIAGYCLIRVPTQAEAIEFAKRWLAIHVDYSEVRLDEAQIEIRRVHELEDFPVDPAETPDGWRAREAAFRASQG